MVERTVRGRLEPREDRHPGQRQGASQGCAGLHWVEGTRGFKRDPDGVPWLGWEPWEPLEQREQAV